MLGYALNGPPSILAATLNDCVPLGEVLSLHKSFCFQLQAKHPNTNSVSPRFVGEKMDGPVSSGALSNFRSGMARRHAGGCTHYDVMGIPLAWPQVWDGLMPWRGITGSWSPSTGLLGQLSSGLGEPWRCSKSQSQGRDRKKTRKQRRTEKGQQGSRPWLYYWCLK